MAKIDVYSIYSNIKYQKQRRAFRRVFFYSLRARVIEIRKGEKSFSYFLKQIIPFCWWYRKEFGVIMKQKAFL